MSECKRGSWKTYDEAKAAALRYGVRAMDPTLRAYLDAAAAAYTRVHEGKEAARKAYEEAFVSSWKAFKKRMTRAWKTFKEWMARVLEAYVEAAAKTGGGSEVR